MLQLLCRACIVISVHCLYHSVKSKSCVMVSKFGITAYGGLQRRVSLKEPGQRVLDSDRRT